MKLLSFIVQKYSPFFYSFVFFFSFKNGYARCFFSLSELLLIAALYSQLPRRSHKRKSSCFKWKWFRILLTFFFLCSLFRLALFCRRSFRKELAVRFRWIYIPRLIFQGLIVFSYFLQHVIESNGPARFIPTNCYSDFKFRLKIEVLLHFG